MYQPDKNYLKQQKLSFGKKTKTSLAQVLSDFMQEQFMTYTAAGDQEI